MSHPYSCFVALQYFFIASRESEKVRKGRKRSLFLFCIGGNRITATVKSSYRLFCEVLGKKEVPIALAVTHLEREAVMEDWQRNGKSLDKNGIHSTGHACITTLDTIRFPFHDHNADNGIHARLLALLALSSLEHHPRLKGRREDVQHRVVLYDARPCFGGTLYFRCSGYDTMRLYRSICNSAVFRTMERVY